MPILLRDGIPFSGPISGPVVTFGPEGHPPPHVLAGAYGATLFSPEVHQLVDDDDADAPFKLPPRGDVLPYPTGELTARLKPFPLGLLTPAKPGDAAFPYWRNGAWLDLANVVEMLRDRGLQVDYNPEHPARRDAPVYVTINASMTGVIRVSHDERQPYTLLIITADDTAILPGRTTTATGVIQIVDAFLAGLKVGSSR